MVVEMVPGVEDSAQYKSEFQISMIGCKCGYFFRAYKISIYLQSMSGKVSAMLLKPMTLKQIEVSNFHVKHTNSRIGGNNELTKLSLLYEIL